MIAKIKKKEIPYSYDLVIVLLVASCAFTKHITPFFFAVSDILFGIGIATAFLKLFFNGKKYIVPNWAIVIFAMWVWALIPLLESNNQNRVNYFESGEFLLSYLKLIYYSFGAIIAGIYINQANVQSIVKSISFTLVLIFLVGFYATINGYLESLLGFSMPYKFIWLGQGDYISYFVDGFALVPFKSTFQEGSHYARFILLFLFFILIHNKQLLLKNYQIYLLIFFSIFLTWSLTAYFLGFIFIFLSLFSFKISHILRPASISPKLIFLLILAFIPLILLGEYIFARIIGRTFEVFAGSDRSSLFRFITTYQTAMFSIAEFPWTGSGLGHPSKFFDLFHGSSILNTGILETTFTDSKMHIVYAYLAASMGIPGLILGLCMMLFIIFGVGFRGFILFFISLFATGTFLECAFWITFTFLTLKKHE